MGVLSPGRPIATVELVEDAGDGDDVNIDDVILGDVAFPPPDGGQPGPGPEDIEDIKDVLTKLRLLREVERIEKKIKLIAHSQLESVIDRGRRSQEDPANMERLLRSMKWLSVLMGREGMLGDPAGEIFPEQRLKREGMELLKAAMERARAEGLKGELRHLILKFDALLELEQAEWELKRPALHSLETLAQTMEDHGSDPQAVGMVWHAVDLMKKLIDVEHFGTNPEEGPFGLDLKKEIIEILDGLAGTQAPTPGEPVGPVGGQIEEAHRLVRSLNEMERVAVKIKHLILSELGLLQGRLAGREDVGELPRLLDHVHHLTMRILELEGKPPRPLVGEILPGGDQQARELSFAPPVNYGVGDLPDSVTAGDLDGDGDLDLAVADVLVAVLLNNGDGTFALPVSYGAGITPQTVAMGDLDGDGDLDLATANVSSDNVSVLLNNGDGSLATPARYGAGDSPVSVVTADLDGDGHLDLAVGNGNATSSDVSVLLNNGDGTFALAVNYGAGQQPVSVAAGDLDGDGDLDLATANVSSDNVSVLLNNGDATFAERVEYGAGNGPESVAAADLDGDGDLDLAAGNALSDDVSVLLNNGDGTFSSHVVYGAGDRPGSVAVADLDSDGDLDLAVANRDSDNVSVLQNNGDGTFSPAVAYGAGNGSQSVVAGDLDGDGDPDLAVANRFSDNISVLINQTAPPPPLPLEMGIKHEAIDKLREVSDLLQAASGITAGDDFDAPELEPLQWRVSIDPEDAGTVELVDGELVFTVNPNDEPERGLNVINRCAVNGDFDAQVDYELLT